MDLRLMANQLVGRTFKTKVNASGFSGEAHVWNKVREFTIEHVYEHHVLCRHHCEGEGNENSYLESFNEADLEFLGVLDEGRRKK